jgi:HlyD family secretion protein
VANRSQGSVVREAEPVVTLVPSHGTMIANVWITSKDIGYIKDGDEVRIKVDAFPFQRHGSLRGYVRSITKSSYSSNQTDMGLPHSNGPQTSMQRSIIRLTASPSPITSFPA